MGRSEELLVGGGGGTPGISQSLPLAFGRKDGSREVTPSRHLKLSPSSL